MSAQEPGKAQLSQPAASSGRQGRAERTRRRILDAALRVMAARTVRHMQDIMCVALDRYLDDLDNSSPDEKTAGDDTPAWKTK